MNELLSFCEQAARGPDQLDSNLHGLAESCGVIGRSVSIRDGVLYFALHHPEGKLGVYGDTGKLRNFTGKALSDGGRTLMICPMNTENADALRQKLHYLNPVSRKGHKITVGLGDRLGLATPGHLRLVSGKGVFPVTAQQSIRELTLTGRTYAQVLASAVWGAFTEGYRDGFGADGDHLKNAFEIEYAIKSGYSMITLDCSEHIMGAAGAMEGEALARAYDTLPVSQRETYEKRYLDRSFSLNSGGFVCFGKTELMRSALIFQKAVDFACDIYEDYIKPLNLDFEISVDETPIPTTPENHFFAANELYLRGVQVETLAPRFCGDFQKGIDYIGDAEQFKREYKEHEAIARHFGYRLSIHSGSDKFTVFPIIGRYSRDGFHVKTAGTNWLEALRVIASVNPGLIRRIYHFAVSNLDTAKAYYHIVPTRETAPDISGWRDEELPGLIDDDLTRQILHITFGLILRERSEGRFAFRGDIYRELSEHGEEYAGALAKHIGKHLELLGI